MKGRKEISIKARRHNSRKLPLPSVAITQMSQMCALTPPHCAPELSPRTPPGVREQGLITLFALQCSGAQCGLEEQDRTKPAIIELCLWDLEPAASCSSIFILKAKQRGLICFWLEKLGNVFFYSVLLLWNTSFGGKLFYFFLFIFYLIFCLLGHFFKKKQLNL